MSNNIEIGKEGENAAIEYLKAKSYKILHTNWRFRHLELDIVAQINKTVAFIEVKSRTGTYFQQPFQAVNKKKQQFIIEAANAYIEKYNIDFEARFDIVSIVIENGIPKIDHIEDAFYPMVK